MRLDEAARDVRGHEAFVEGASLLSPDAAEDDVVFDADLRDRFLALTNAQVMVLGHSCHCSC